MTSPLQWFDEQSFVTQLLVLMAVCDPLGAALGYALHPTLGVDPLVGIAFGLVVGSVPLSAFVLREAQSDAESESDDEWADDDW